MPAVCVADGQQQIISILLTEKARVYPPQEIINYFRNTMLVDEKRRYQEDLDARRITESKLRQAFPRYLGSMAVPHLLQSALRNAAHPDLVNTQTASDDFIGFGGRTHTGLRAHIAHEAESYIVTACQTTIAEVDSEHYAHMQQVFKSLTENLKDLNAQTLDRDLGANWRDTTWRAGDLLSEDFRWSGRKLAPTVRQLLLGMNKTSDLDVSFINAVKTGAEFGALGIAGMYHALSNGDYAEQTWNAHVASHIRMLTLPASLPFWVAHSFAANRSEESIKNIYSTETRSNGDPRLRFNDPAIQRFYDLKQRTACQGAMVEESLSPNGPENIDTAYQQIGRLAQIDGRQLETDIDPEDIKRKRMSGAMATSLLVLSTVLA